MELKKPSLGLALAAVSLVAGLWWIAARSDRTFPLLLIHYPAA